MKIISLFFSFLLLTTELFSGFQNYLKPIEDKQGPHCIRNIDFIYLINLDRRPEKFLLCEKELTPYGIFPYRFSAVDGWAIPIQAFSELGVTYEPWMKKGIMGTCYFPEDGGEPHHELIEVPGRNYFCHCMPRGSIGIVLSHLSVLQDALKSGYKTIWVMEDDIQVIQDPHLLSDRIQQLDKLVGSSGWDILFTDQDTKNQQGVYVPCLSYAPRPDFSPKDPIRFSQRKQVSPLFRQIGARYGAYSMIIRRSGIKKILDYYSKHPIFLPYDMDCFLPKLRIFTVVDDIVSTLPNAFSNNGVP